MPSSSRRNFLRYASLAAASAPILTESAFARAARQQQQVYTFGANHPARRPARPLAASRPWAVATTSTITTRSW
jgi:hypothetical protein